MAASCHALRIFRAAIRNNNQRTRVLWDSFTASKTLNYGQFSVQAVRHLYCASILRLDKFQLKKISYEDRLGAGVDPLKTRLREAMENPDYFVLTEDLQVLTHLASTEEDIQLAVSMLRRMSQQAESEDAVHVAHRGPSVMRMVYVLNKPAVGLQLFRDQETSRWFQNSSSKLLLMDLLFNSGMYQEVVDVSEGSQLQNMLQLLVVAALYKINTPEALTQCVSLANRFFKHGPKGIGFSAQLAINQGKPVTALELLSKLQPIEKFRYTDNLKAIALAQLGRVQDAVMVLDACGKVASRKHHDIQKDTLDIVETGVKQSGSLELQVQFENLKRAKTRSGLVDPRSMDHLLCQPVYGWMSEQPSQRLMRKNQR